MTEFNSSYGRIFASFVFDLQTQLESSCAMVFGGVVSRDGLGLGRIIGAPAREGCAL